MARPVGIDLGTTYSAVAYVDEDGKARVLANADGRYLVPSVVLFEEEGIVVGDTAKDGAVASADRVVSCVKRYMGDSNYSFPYKGTAYTAEMISAEILKDLKAVAERTLGPVSQAVITVPAYFHDAERTATRRAGEMAGLEVLKIINEPTAAALSYGIDEDQRSATFLVYDLGGGTFDVTVMRARGGTAFEMVTTAGNHRLGGRDWDERVRDFVAEAFKAQHGADPRDDVFSEQDLLRKAEQAKISLSQTQKTRVVCQHAGKSSAVELTREQFEAMTSDLLDMTATEVQLALDGASLRPEAIDLVLLVGGSSKMPMVRRLMESKGRALKMSRNPDHCVALGAAIQAAMLVSGKAKGAGLYKAAAVKKLGSIRVQDRTPHSLGLIAVEGDHLVNSIIIPKGTEVPCERSRDDYTTQHDNQDTLTVHLVQGEAEDPEACVPLASYDFKGIPPRRAGTGRIRVSYRYNADTIVEASAADLKSGKTLEKATRALVDISELAQPKKVALPRAVALLMDSSGSMSGSSLAEAQRAAEAFIENTNFACVDMGIVQFGMGGDASAMQCLCRDARALQAAVARLVADGGTPMAEAIECGTGLVNGGGSNAERFIVLFTDGCPNDDAYALRAADEAKRTGIKIICIGVQGADRALLDQIASASQDSFFAATGEQLAVTFGNIAQLISGTEH